MLQPIDWGMLGKLITRNGGEKVELHRPLGVIPDQTKPLKDSRYFLR